MLGYVISPGRGVGDRLLAAVADALAARGVAVAGAVHSMSITTRRASAT